jgi:hypothetical protein
MTNRKPHSTLCNSVAAAVSAAQAVAAGDIPVPDCVTLRAVDLPFWQRVTRARAREEWTDADLIVAVELAQTMADIKIERGLLAVEGSVLTNERGTPVANPRFTVLQSLTQRQMALFRGLQMQPTVNGKRAREMAGKRETERKARAAHRQVTDELDPDSLLA